MIFFNYSRRSMKNRRDESTMKLVFGFKTLSKLLSDLNARTLINRDLKKRNYRRNGRLPLYEKLFLPGGKKIGKS